MKTIACMLPKCYLAKWSFIVAGALMITFLAGCGGTSASDEAVDPQKVEAEKQKLMEQGPPPVPGESKSPGQ